MFYICFFFFFFKPVSVGLMVMCSDLLPAMPPALPDEAGAGFPESQLSWGPGSAVFQQA